MGLNLKDYYELRAKEIEQNPEKTKEEKETAIKRANLMIELDDIWNRTSERRQESEQAHVSTVVK
ncbi:MAG: hypothetical protein BWZ03_00265 [bacterium ADurb.BinA186]|nr:MAG: hypothetical protein BWZ03_00265 [bacterium ADurb.BinA186]